MKFFARKILKTLNKMDPHRVHIMVKNYVIISIGLAVGASLSINNSLILVLYSYILLFKLRNHPSTTYIKSSEINKNSALEMIGHRVSDVP